MAAPKGFSAQELHSPVFKQCDVSYVPIFLGGVMKACGNTPPIQIKNKDKWINIERLRWARQFNVPMTEEMPEGFPPSTLGIQRVLCALVLMAPDKILETLSALYQAFWVDRKAIQKPAHLLPVLERVLGEKMAKEVMERSNSAEAKKLLSANSEKALEEGAFGLPWFVATNADGKKECFWGFDHIGQVVAHLGLERPKPGSANEGGWRSML
ncbi:MAG: hypothetical protein M1830_003761 [Pleopsidium flavum]|nr:MAG: hypothetical protein M1830_003761 [Pleopsidium flavum]